MTSNLSQNDSCDKVPTILTNAYKGVLIGEIIASSLALTPNFILMCIIGKVAVLPANLRLLLGATSFCLAWLALGNMIKEIYVLTAPSCAFVISQLGCKLMDLALYSVALSSTFYLLTAVCVERLIATLLYKRYDSTHWHNKPYLGLALTIIVFFVAVFINGYPAKVLSNDAYVPICAADFTASTSISPYMSYIYLGLECVDAVVTLFVYYYNRRMAKIVSLNRARFSLSARFLIDQNVQVNGMVVPSMMLHLLFFTPSYLTSSLNKLVNADNNAMKQLISRVTILVRLIYAILHPIIALHVNDHLRQYLITSTPFGPFLQRMGVTGTKQAVVDFKTGGGGGGNKEEHHDHFDRMDKLWDNIKKQEPIKKVIKSNKIDAGDNCKKVAWTDENGGGKKAGKF